MMMCRMGLPSSLSSCKGFQVQKLLCLSGLFDLNRGILSAIININKDGYAKRGIGTVKRDYLNVVPLFCFAASFLYRPPGRISPGCLHEGEGWPTAGKDRQYAGVAQWQSGGMSGRDTLTIHWLWKQSLVSNARSIQWRWFESNRPHRCPIPISGGGQSERSGGCRMNIRE